MLEDLVDKFNGSLVKQIVYKEDLNTIYIILGGVKILNLLNKANSIKDIICLLYTSDAADE